MKSLRVGRYYDWFDRQGRLYEVRITNIDQRRGTVGMHFVGFSYSIDSKLCIYQFGDFFSHNEFSKTRLSTIIADVALREKYMTLAECIRELSRVRHLGTGMLYCFV